MRRRTLYTSISYTPHVAFCSKFYNFGFVNKTRKTPSRYKKALSPLYYFKNSGLVQARRPSASTTHTRIISGETLIL